MHGLFTQIALAETYSEDHLFKTLDSFLISPSFGAVWYTGFDLGFPEIRATTVPLPGASGTFDETKWHGSRVISMDLVVLQNGFGGIPAASGWDSSVNWESADYWLTRLGGWMRPERRYRLYFTKKGTDPRWADVRPAAMSAPVGLDDGGGFKVQLQWVNPSGRFYSFNDTFDPDNADAPQGATRDGRNRKDVLVFGTPLPGRSYPETAPYVRNYPTPPRGTDSVLYRGTAATGFIARLHALNDDLENPRLTLYAPNGEVTGSIGLTYTVSEGDFVEVDTENREVLLNGVAGNRLNQYMAAPTKWPTLVPGRDPLAASNVEQVEGYNKIDFEASSYGAGSYCELAFYDAFLV